MAPARRIAHRPARGTVLVLAGMAFPWGALADDRPPQGVAHPTPLWTALQLAPSPGVLVSQGTASLSLEWQLTPALYAFGVRPEVPRWRTFIVEPLVRYGGSIEVYYAPEYLGLEGGFASRWGLRAGARVYLPLVQHGDNLAASLGASDMVFRGEHALFIDAGMYVLYGVVGVAVGWSPEFLGSQAWLVSLHLRYF